MQHRTSESQWRPAVKLMLGVGTIHTTKERRDETLQLCPGLQPSALGQRGLHFLQQTAQQCGVTALSVHRHGALTLGDSHMHMLHILQLLCMLHVSHTHCAGQRLPSSCLQLGPGLSFLVFLNCGPGWSGTQQSSCLSPRLLNWHACTATPSSKSF